MALAAEKLILFGASFRAGTVHTSVMYSFIVAASVRVSWTKSGLSVLANAGVAAVRPTIARNVDRLVSAASPLCGLQLACTR